MTERSEPRVPTAKVIQIAPVLRADGGTDVWYLFDNGEVWVGQQGASDYRQAWPPPP